MVQRILVLLDGSEQAESTLPLACIIASMSDAEITLLRIVGYPSDVFSSTVHSGSYPNPVAEPDLDEKLRARKEVFSRKVKGYLERLAASIETSMSKVSIDIREGSIVDAILSSIKELEINMIVMSTMGKHRNPWMLGAIANRILREAQVPVILMRKEPCGLVPDRSNRQEYFQADKYREAI